jgi:hypothetical protein
LLGFLGDIAGWFTPLDFFPAEVPDGKLVDKLLGPPRDKLKVNQFNPLIPITVTGGSIASQSNTTQKGPRDPNFLSGPNGFGPQGFVPVNASLPYAVYFENKATASAPAQVVSVTQQLDPSLDWSTFQLGDFSFGNFTVVVPPGRQDYSTRVDARNSLGVYVDVSAGLNRPTPGRLSAAPACRRRRGPG